MWEVLIQLKQGLTANLLACLLPVCFKHMTILKYYLLTGVMDVEPFINGAQEVVSYMVMKFQKCQQQQKDVGRNKPISQRRELESLMSIVFRKYL